MTHIPELNREPTVYYVSLNVAVSSPRHDLDDHEVLDLAGEHIRGLVERNDFHDALEWYDTEGREDAEGEEA